MIKVASVTFFISTPSALFIGITLTSFTIIMVC